MTKKITLEECTKQVRRMGNLFGLLYYHFAKTIINELGDKRGKELILKAVYSYGVERGQVIREKVLAAGLDLTLENFFKFQRLPSLGWEADEEGVTYCCYAEPWIQRDKQELGKLYCEIDFAKIEGYNPKIRMSRISTILDGEACCKYTYDEGD